MGREIETLAEFDHVVATGDLRRCAVQGVDLSQRGSQLAHCQVDGALFLGCSLAHDVADGLARRGAIVLPDLDFGPLRPHRGSLYHSIDLYDTYPGGSYADSYDARVYRWLQGPQRETLHHQLAQGLHDHAVTDALTDGFAANGHSVVGIMGGHAMQRGSEDYEETAQLAFRLATAGKLVASGGGPGAMEAANLGARLSGHGTAALQQALEMVASTPSFRPSIDAWAAQAFAVLERFAGGADSLGIPTWFYGHEPPNVFASHIAKYCSNAIREDMLLRLCGGGLIYLPGAAGTVQELFQAVTGNYYAADSAELVPLVLVGVQYWTKALPAWPLLASLAEGREMAQAIVLVDTAAEAGDWLLARGA
ncbi:MAG: Rossmann fold nucleotide-binding protein [Arachnia propionica]|nr:MAG: Rossmann fold nucleotide-binding protein [Arachnia propionica]